MFSVLLDAPVSRMFCVRDIAHVTINTFHTKNKSHFPAISFAQCYLVMYALLIYIIA